MPTVRGLFIPEREKTCGVKRSFDLLLWIDQLNRDDVSQLQLLEQLRVYLKARYLGVCQIRLLVPNSLTETREALRRNLIPFEVVLAPDVDQEFVIEHENLRDDTIFRPALCAKMANADCLVVSKGSLALSFAEDLVKSLHCLVTDPSFLLALSEIYARGFGVPWSFRSMVWNATWDSFYLYAEPLIFGPLMSLVRVVQGAGCSQETVEAARSIVFNRLPQVCYVRDTLQWLDLQREAARRGGFTNQTFLFEVSYHLNFYYLVLSGTFDHLALLVNEIYSLGLPDTQIGATSKRFLAALEPKSQILYSLFTSAKITDFIARLRALRNLAAHRGSITPRKVVQKPDRAPTTDEIDQHLRATGNDWILTEPHCSISPQLVAIARSNAEAEILERNAIAEDMEMIEYNGKRGMVSPVLDVPWNFAMVRDFTLAVAHECSTYLATPPPNPINSNPI